MELLRDAGEWIASNWTALGTFIFTAVVAWAAIVGHRLNERLTDAELDPAVTVYIELGRYAHSSFDLVIKNAGRGAARNVSFRVEPEGPGDASEGVPRLSNMAIFQRGIAFLGPSQELRTYYGSYPELEANPMLVHVTYERESSERRRQRMVGNFPLDVRIFEGMSQVGEHPDITSARALKQIAEDVRQVRRGSDWATISVSVKRQYVFSRRVNELWNRWFGTPYIDSSASPWRTFRDELRRTLTDARRRVRE